MPDTRPYDSADPSFAGRMKSWPVLLVLGRFGFVGLLLVLGVEIVRHSVGDILSNDNPGLSILVDPAQYGARLSVSETLLAENPPKIDEALASARQALSTNPFLPGALTLLARESEKTGDEDLTRRLMTLASQLNLRDLSAQLWLLSYDLRVNYVDSALRRIDVILRGQNRKVIEDHLDSALAPIIAQEPYRLAYAKLLLANPPWRYLTDLIRHSTDLSGLTNLFAELQALGSGPTQKELQVGLNMLIQHGMFDEAHDIWMRSLPPERGEEADLLYNHGFRYQLTNLPFDWVIEPVPNAMVRFDSQANEQIMNVDFFGGRVKFEHVSHLLNLAPGSYRYQGRERAQALQNDRGLQWIISCADGEGESLGTTEPLNGDIAWRPFAVDFTVPTGKCFYQYLVLVLRARAALETEVVGRVSYADLDLRPKHGPDDSGSLGVSLKTQERK
jgi:hypothetical protein